MPEVEEHLASLDYEQLLGLTVSRAEAAPQT